ncbi:MAG TPA: BTAD domain-containing putative transcriptional regulator [Gemmatimonadota bacterium]|nr:BTAD domain-containing putative transcriptional regulator [Gemmatimonadota bacterium]
MEFRILGPLEVVEEGQPIDVAGGRQRALLALLLLHANEVVSRDRLIDGLWKERPPATAPKVLQNAVSQLRRSLGDNLIVTRPPGYLLRVDPDTIDAHRFEALLEDGRRMLAAGETEQAAAILREALALWRGRALDEFTYEPFAEAEVARLHELRLRALEERVEADLALGRHTDLVAELERLVAEQPLQERSRAQLMLALYRSDRQAEALRVYEDGRRLLASELGLEPGAALRRLEKQILTRDPNLEAPPVVPLLKDQRPRMASETMPKRPLGRLAFGFAAIALVAAALVGVLLLAEEDASRAVQPNSVVKIDPETGEVVDVFPVGPDAWKATIVGNYVFVSSDEREILARIDARSGAVDIFGSLLSPSGMTAGVDGTLWVGTDDTNEVWQIDGDSLERLQVLELPETSRPWSVAVGGGSVWVSEGPAASVSRFKARTGRLQARYEHAGRGFSAEVAFGEGAAWTAANGPGGNGELLRVDAVGGAAQSIEIGRVPYAVTVGFDAVWVSDFVHAPFAGAEPEPGKVLRLDPLEGILDNVIDVGKRPVAIATGGGSVWVANNGDKTISEIDPRTNQVIDTIPTRYNPQSLAYGDGFLWVSLGSELFDF